MVDYDASSFEESEDEDLQQAEQVAAQDNGTATERIGKGKLWSKRQFPEGTDEYKNWDMANLKAAQQWCCPCTDRQSCIGPDRLSVLDLYDHRKQFRTTAHLQGGYRDACRDDLQRRYDTKARAFTRSFKVNDALSMHICVTSHAQHAPFTVHVTVSLMCFTLDDTAHTQTTDLSFALTS